MIYQPLSNCVKNVLHWCIDNTVPSTPTNALITSWFGWYIHKVLKHNIPFWEWQIKSKHFNCDEKWFSVHCAAWISDCLFLGPLYSEQVRHFTAVHLTILSTCGVSFTLNQIAKIMFHIENYKTKKKEISPPEVLITDQIEQPSKKLSLISQEPVKAPPEILNQMPLSQEDALRLSLINETSPFQNVCSHLCC